MPVQSACATAWACGEQLSFKHLMPEGVKAGRDVKLLATEADLRTFLDGLVVTKDQAKRQRGRKPEKRKRFSTQEQDEIVKGASCVLRLARPIETALLSNTPLSNEVLVDFLAIWKSALRPDVHWNAETGTDSVARRVGLGLASSH